MKNRVILLLSLAPVLAPLQACSGGAGEPLCSGRVSVPEYVLRFGQGLANFDDSLSLTLEADSVSVLDVVLAARDAPEGTGTTAGSLATTVAGFVGVMNSHDWIISDALEDPRATSAADALGTEESLRAANTVEALVLARCGSAPTVPAPSSSVDTLPPPPYPGPDDTLPEAGLPDDASDATALGRAVAIQYGLTLSQEQVRCLGTALQGIMDATEAVSSPRQYQEQFQPAFDSCGIDFEVPGS